MTVNRRLVLLERAFGPTPPRGCRWIGGRCATYPLVRVGSDAPPVPDSLSATCPTCGRPRFVRTYVVVAGDAAPPAVADPEADG